MTDIDDDYEPSDDREPSEPDWDREEYYRYLNLSPLGRLAYDLRAVFDSWRWRLKARVGWTGYSDEPPF